MLKLWRDATDFSVPLGNLLCLLAVFWGRWRPQDAAVACSVATKGIALALMAGFAFSLYDRWQAGRADR